MIEYKLFNTNNSPITIEDYAKISSIIKGIFPETGKNSDNINKMGDIIRETYGVNGNAFHIYYRDKDAQIFLPEEHEKSIKEKIASLELKCQ
jgi:hypothetical protein